VVGKLSELFIDEHKFNITIIYTIILLKPIEQKLLSE